MKKTFEIIKPLSYLTWSLVVVSAVILLASIIVWATNNESAAAPMSANNRHLNAPITFLGPKRNVTLSIIGQIAISYNECGKEDCSTVTHKVGVTAPTQVCAFVKASPEERKGAGRSCTKIKVDSPDGSFKIDIPVSENELKYLKDSDHYDNKSVFIYAYNPLSKAQAGRGTFAGYTIRQIGAPESVDSDYDRRWEATTHSRIVIKKPIVLKGNKKFLGIIPADGWGEPYFQAGQSVGFYSDDFEKKLKENGYTVRSCNDTTATGDVQRTSAKSK